MPRAVHVSERHPDVYRYAYRGASRARAVMDDQGGRRQRPRSLRGAAARERERAAGVDDHLHRHADDAHRVFVDPAGRAATEYYILVFSADRAHWTPGSRRVRTTRPATDGAFTIKGIPPAIFPLRSLT